MPTKDAAGSSSGLWTTLVNAIDVVAAATELQAQRSGKPQWMLSWGCHWSCRVSAHGWCCWGDEAAESAS